MKNYAPLAKLFSFLDLPVDLPKDKSKWNIGHHFLAEFEEKRKKVLKPTLLPEVSTNNILRDFWFENKFLKQCDNETIIQENKEFFSFWDKLKSKLLLGYYFFPSKLLMIRSKCVKNLVQKIYNRMGEVMATIRKEKKFINSGLEKNLMCCGEFARIAQVCLYHSDIKSHVFIMNFINKKGKPRTMDHEFVFFRTDGKPVTTASMVLQDLYHPNMRVLDLWAGKCLPPKEMFEFYANFMTELVITPNSSPKPFLAPINPGAQLVLQPWHIEDPKVKYVVGHVYHAGVTRFGERPYNHFAPLCVPHPFSPDKEPQRIPLTKERIAERMVQAKAIQMQRAIRQQLRERS